MPRKPGNIARDAELSAIWDDLCSAGTSLTEQDVPALELLCLWHAIAREARRQMSSGGGLAILDPIAVKPIPSDDGEPQIMMRKAPAVSVLKEATSEIRALSDALGITPSARSRIGAESKPRADSARAELLAAVLADRASKEKRAAGA